jgi:hypothetical protein
MTSWLRPPPRSLGQAAERVLRAALSRRLAREIAGHERRGTRVIRIEPTAYDLGLMGASFMDDRRAGFVLSLWRS